MASTAGPVTAAQPAATGMSAPSPAAAGAAQQPAGARAADEPRFTVAVSCRVDGEAAQVSFTTFRRTLIQQIMDSSLAFFKISPSQSQTAQLVLGGKQVISFSAQSTVEDLKLTTPDRQSLELVLLDEEPEVTFPVRDQYGNEELLRARLYHPFVDAVRRLLDPDSPALQAQPTPAPPPAPAATSTTSTGGSNSQQNQQQPHGLDVDLYRSSDVSLISLQNSPAACGLQGGEPLLLYRYGRCSREYWQGLGQPERGLKPTFAGLYISDYKNQGQPDRMRPHGPERRDTDAPLAQQQQQPSSGTQHGVHSASPPTGRRRPCRLQFQGRAVFRHDLAMPLEYLLSTYCKWRGIEKDKASFLWLQFYMRLGLRDTGLGRGMDDGDTIYIFDKQDPQGKLWDGVLDGNVAAVRLALDEGSSLEGPEGSFEAITSRWPLHAAAANNHLSVAEALVERGADVDKLDAVSEPALWHAVEQGHGEMVALLLKLGATASDLPCPPGKTKADYAALCHAAEKGSLAMVQLLLDKGANPYTYDDTGYCAYDYLVDQAKPLELLRALLNADSAFSTTQKSYQQAYQRLCAAVKRAQRYPALGCNCRTCNSVVEVRAAEAEATQTLKAQIGCVALVRAVQAGGPHCLEAMQLLHAHGALLDGQDQDGRTALHQAIRYNRLAEAKWLVSAGAHLDVADFEGLLPLHQAACTGNVEFARLLVEAGAPINLHTVKYITQESLEAQTKKQEAGSGGRKAAKKRNALDVTGLTTIGGNSALALAVRHGHAAVVEYLLSQQASFDLKNPADSSAFHAALDRGAASVASKLLQHLNKPKPGKAGAGVSTALVTAGASQPAASKIKAKDTTASKDKASRKAALSIADASCKVGAAGSGGAVGTGITGSGGAGHSASDSDGGEKGAGGDVSSPEPALAVDAGAGLREIVQAERERLRQEKGLGRAPAADASVTTGAAASTLKQAPSLMQQLEALKAAEKAAAAKAAADQQQAAAAAKTRAEAESAAADRARLEAESRKQAEQEAARAKAEEAAKRKAEEEQKRRQEEAASVKRKAEEEAAAAKRKAIEAAAAAAATAAAAAQAKAEAEQSKAHASTTFKGNQGGKPAAGALHNNGNSNTEDQSSTAAGDSGEGDAAAAVKPPGVQILFRSTSTAVPAPTKQQQQQGPPPPAATHQKAGRHAATAPAATAAAESKCANAAVPVPASPIATPAPGTGAATPSGKKGKGRGKAAAAAAAACDGDQVGPSPPSVPNTPSKHTNSEHGSTHKQASNATGAGGKRGAANKIATAPTAAALAASAALAHSTATIASRSSGGSQHLANGPSHSVGFDSSSYNGGYDDHAGMLHGGSHTVTPGMSPRHGSIHMGSSAATTPVRSSKPSSRRNSFSSGSLSALQHGWPGHQQQPPHPGMLQQQQDQQQHQPGHDMQGLFAGTGGHPSLRLPPGIMVSATGQGLGELGGPGLHMAPQHHLSPLRHSPAGPRVPASGTPTAAQDENGLWDDAGHLESFVMSVVTEEAVASSNGLSITQQQPSISRSGGSQQHLGKLDGNGPQTPFSLRMPSGGAAAAAAAWDMGQQHVHQAGGNSNGMPRAPAPGMAQRAATAPHGLDRASSADVLASMAAQHHVPADAGRPPRPGGLGGLSGTAEQPFAGWMQGGQQTGGLDVASAASWSQQQQGSAQQGAAGAGPPPGWSSWQPAANGTSAADAGTSAGQKGTGSADSAKQFMSGATGGSLSLSGSLSTTLLVGAAPFVPGEPSHWQARSGSTGEPTATSTQQQPRELDPLPHLPASLFEDDADVPAQVVLEPPPPAPSTGTAQQQGRGSTGQQGNASGGQQQGHGGGNAGGGGQQGHGGGGQQGPGMGAQGGRGMQANRPSSRGRPSAGVHARTASAGTSQDGSGGGTGRYPSSATGVRMGMGAYPGLTPSGPQQPSLPGLYGGPQQEPGWYGQQGSWQGLGQGQGYPGAMGGVAAASQHVQGPGHAHPAAAMYQVLSSMGGAAGAGLGGAPGWAEGGGGPQMNGYWPPMGRGPQGMSEMMGVQRGRGVAPSQGQPPRYRQH